MYDIEHIKNEHIKKSWFLELNDNRLNLKCPSFHSSDNAFHSIELINFDLTNSHESIFVVNYINNNYSYYT